MATSGKDKAEKVRTAKKWLSKAEASFDDNADVRGELNLMLAEAEMKNLRKNHDTGKNVRTLLALGVAIVLAGAVWQLHGWFWEGNQPETATVEQRAVTPVTTSVASPNSTHDQETTAVVPSEAAGGDSVSPPPAIEKTTFQKADTEAAPVPQEQAVTVTHTAPVREKVLTNRQVQDAVQDARHTLRGTGTK